MTLTNNDSPRAVLEHYSGQRVPVEGYLGKVHREAGGRFLVALLEDTEVTLGVDRHGIGHVWIQHAEPLKDLQIGDRVGCTCYVRTYDKTTAYEDGEETSVRDWGLSYPEAVEVLPRAVSLRPTTQPAPPPAPPPPAPPPPAVPASSWRPRLGAPAIGARTGDRSRGDSTRRPRSPGKHGV
jgi:hypothetical protein